MRVEEAERLAGPDGIMGARLTGIGIVGDDLVLDLGFRGTDDGDVTLWVPLHHVRASGRLLEVWRHYEEHDDAAL